MKSKSQQLQTHQGSAKRSPKVLRLINENPKQEIDAIKSASHTDSFSFLGMHCCSQSDYLLVRTFQPNATSVSLVDAKSNKIIAKLIKIDESGFFSAITRRKKWFDYRLQITEADVKTRIFDPYRFEAVISENDLKLISLGRHPATYKIMGAHFSKMNNVEGVSFAVWAPNASHVSVIGEFNRWDGRIHSMRLRHDCGIWEIFIPQLEAMQLYKFEIKDQQGNTLPLKSDPYAFQSEFRPHTASLIVDEKDYQWGDHHWLAERGAKHTRDQAISIYEVHLGSWKRGEDNRYLNYRELADELVGYVKQCHFTHIQIMPVSEYPFDGSWGYQPVGLFAPTSRFATKKDNVVDDFKYFVNQFHQAGVGILIDWVPGHFPEDNHGLARFDGSFLYEHADRQKGFHPDWNTLIYNYGRKEVANFLIDSALHWMERFHIDGIRVDAVASMLYLDYSRKPGEWQPNEQGGNQNLEAVAFLQRFNEQLYLNYPDCFSVAEESTAWPGVSSPTSQGGLGFGYKWNMGWMNDSLEYMKRDPIHKKHHQNDMSFSLVYAFDENFILPLSHDEVVHGKGSLLNKMPGDEWQKFANLRAYYGFMWGHPGKKLLFMGGEFGQQKEWDFENGLDWWLLSDAKHLGIQKMLSDLNALYATTPALYQLDCEPAGFEWVDHNDSEHSIFTFIRYPSDRSKPILVICNFTPQTHLNYRVGVPLKGFYNEVFNSDAEIYGGSNQGNLGGLESQDYSIHGKNDSIQICIPPLATLMFEVC